MVSGALDRLHYERDPCVKYDSNRKVWIYLHRNRSEEEFGKIPGIYSIKRPPPISAHPFGRKRLIGTHPHTPPSAPPPLPSPEKNNWGRQDAYWLLFLYCLICLSSTDINITWKRGREASIFGQIFKECSKNQTFCQFCKEPSVFFGRVGPSDQGFSFSFPSTAVKCAQLAKKESTLAYFPSSVEAHISLLWATFFALPRRWSCYG